MCCERLQIIILLGIFCTPILLFNVLAEYCFDCPSQKSMSIFKCPRLRGLMQPYYRRLCSLIAVHMAGKTLLWFGDFPKVGYTHNLPDFTHLLLTMHGDSSTIVNNRPSCPLTAQTFHTKHLCSRLFIKA